jgi:hypothetical protein
LKEEIRDGGTAHHHDAFAERRKRAMLVALSVISLSASLAPDEDLRTAAILR